MNNGSKHENVEALLDEMEFSQLSEGQRTHKQYIYLYTPIQNSTVSPSILIKLLENKLLTYIILDCYLVVLHLERIFESGKGRQ